MPRKYVRKIRGGNLIKISVCTLPNPQDPQKVRNAKSKATTELQQLMNDKAAESKLEFLIAANFFKGDYFITLTVKDEFLPAAESKESEKKQIIKSRISKLLAAYRKVRKNRGELLKYIYVCEGMNGESRYNYHLIINAVKEKQIAKVKEEIESLWPYGAINITYLFTGKHKETSYADISHYLVKENTGKRVGERLWTPSKNLEKPEIEHYWIESDQAIIPPQEALIYDKKQNIVIDRYGWYEYFKYMLRPQAEDYRPRGKKRE